MSEFCPFCEGSGYYSAVNLLDLLHSQSASRQLISFDEFDAELENDGINVGESVSFSPKNKREV